jgi:hypothetical protein
MVTRPDLRARSLALLLTLLALADASCASDRQASQAAGVPLERCGASSPAGSRCAEALRLLGGLRPGSPLGSGEVREVAVVGDRLVVTVSGDGSEVVGIDVVRFDPAAPPPPARAGGLALYLRSDTHGAMTPAWQASLVQALAEAVARDAAPAPPWLGVLGPAPAARAP